MHKGATTSTITAVSTVVYIFVQAATAIPTWTGNGASIAQVKIILIITMEKYKAILTIQEAATIPELHLWINTDRPRTTN